MRPAASFPRPLLVLLLAGIAVACNDPADRYQAPTQDAGPGAAGAPAPGDPATGSPPPQGDQQGVAGPACSVTPVSRQQHPFDDAAAVPLSGRITGTGNGPALIELVRVEGDQRLTTTSFVCSGLGAFSLRAPPDVGAVYLAVFMDPTGDGPTTDDAAGFTGPVQVDGEPLDELEVAVQQGADMGPVPLPYSSAWGPLPRPEGAEPAPEPGIVGPPDATDPPATP